MFKNLLKNSLCAGALLAAGVSHQAMAATVDISGTLFWGVGTPLTAYSAPGAESAFAFDLTTPTGVAAGDPVSVTNYSYALNNVAVLGPTPTVSFYPTSEKGLFNINYGDFRVSLYGADIGSTGVIGPSGFYIASAAMNDGEVPTGNGGVSVSVSAVPLPASLPMFSAALLGLVGVGMKARRKLAA